MEIVNAFPDTAVKIHDFFTTLEVLPAKEKWSLLSQSSTVFDKNYEFIFEVFDNHLL